MCGISGYFSPSGKFRNESLQRMHGCLHHRGPDAEGFFEDELCGLAHRRLAIIDLDQRSNQPFYSENRNLVMVYNGEVYNYPEVASTLKLHNLKTCGDTEVILRGFEQEGLSIVNHLNGMFAIAIYDQTLKELILIRDRIGIKPVYYYWDGKDFAFASELKSLMKLQVKKEINHAADRKSTRLNSSHVSESRMPSSA